MMDPSHASPGDERRWQPWISIPMKWRKHAICMEHEYIYVYTIYNTCAFVCKIHVYSIHIYKYIYISIYTRDLWTKNRCAQGDIMIVHSIIECLDQFPCVLSGMSLAKQVGTPTEASEANWSDSTLKPRLSVHSLSQTNTIPFFGVMASLSQNNEMT